MMIVFRLEFRRMPTKLSTKIMDNFSVRINDIQHNLRNTE